MGSGRDMGGTEKEGGEARDCVGNGGGDGKLISVVGGGLKDGSDRVGGSEFGGGGMLMPIGSPVGISGPKDGADGADGIGGRSDGIA